MRRSLTNWLPLALTVALTTAGAAHAHHPHDVVTALAVSPNFAQDRTLVVGTPGSINLLWISRDGGLTYRPFHRGLEGRLFTSVEFAPDWAQSGTVYLGTSDGGFQVSRDFGRTWQTRPSNLRGNVGQIVTTPTDARGRHHVFASYAARTVHVSDNHGRSFRSIPVPLNGARILSIAASPTFATDGTFLVTSDDLRLHVTRDSGVTWDSYPVGFDIREVEVSPNFSNDSLIWCATWGAGVRLARIDASSPPIWAAAQGVTDPFVNDIEFADPQLGRTPAVIYALGKDKGLFASANYGLQWTAMPISVRLIPQTNSHFRKLRVSPNWRSDGMLFVGMFEGVFLGAHYGLTWLETQVNPTRSGRQVELSPNYATDGTLFAGGYGQAMLRSRDRGATWQSMGVNFRGGSSYDIAVSPSFATDGMVITGQNRGLRLTTDAGDSWRVINLPAHPRQPDPFGVGVWTLRDVEFSPNYATDNTIYAASAVGAIYRSTDRGLNWNWVNPSILPSTNIRTIALSPSFAQDGTLFASGWPALYVSRNGGLSFLETQRGNFIEDTLLIPPDFATRGEFYSLIVRRGFVILSSLGTVTVESNQGFDGQIPTMIVLSKDFANDQTIYATTSGNGLYRSTNRGRSWSRVTVDAGVIANAHALNLSPNFANDRTLFAGTPSGHTRSTDGGASWSLVTTFETYDDDRAPWSFDGSWREVWIPDSAHDGVRQSPNRGDRTTLPFDGTGVELFGANTPDGGQAVILLDGAVVASVDTYSSTSQGHASWFKASGLRSGLHVLEILVTGTGNAASTGTMVSVDEAHVTYR